MMFALQKIGAVPSVTAADDAAPVSGSGSASDGRTFTSPVDYLRHGPESAYEHTSTRVDEGGQFHFGELEPGVIVVAAFAKGLSAPGQLRVMLQPGQRVANVDLALSEAEPLLATVVDSASTPVAG